VELLARIFEIWDLVIDNKETGGIIDSGWWIVIIL
jgi:hypothetical protein